MKEDFHLVTVGHSTNVPFRCVLCGTLYEASSVVALVSYDVHYGDICPECIDSGPKSAAANARFHRIQDMNSYKEDVGKGSAWTLEDFRAVAHVIDLADQIENSSAEEWALYRYTGKASLVTLDSILGDDVPL